MTRVIALVGCFLLIPVFAISISSADTISIEQIEATLNRSPRMCPKQSDLVEVTLTSYKAECGENYETAMSLGQILECQKRTDHANSLIEKYNEFIRQCRAAGNETKSNAKSSTTSKRAAPAENQRTQPKPEEKSELEKAREAAKKKAQGAEENNAAAIASVKQEAQANQARRREEEAKRAQEEKARREREDAARRERELAEARKWHCYGGFENAAEGFNECRSACGDFYNPLYCKQVCYSSGNESISNGRSCFREP